MGTMETIWWHSGLIGPRVIEGGLFLVIRGPGAATSIWDLRCNRDDLAMANKPYTRFTDRQARWARSEI